MRSRWVSNLVEELCLFSTSKWLSARGLYTLPKCVYGTPLPRNMCKKPATVDECFHRCFCARKRAAMLTARSRDMPRAGLLLAYALHQAPPCLKYDCWQATVAASRRALFPFKCSPLPAACAQLLPTPTVVIRGVHISLNQQIAMKESV
jgi:hypothetical protein